MVCPGRRSDRGNRSMNLGTALPSALEAGSNPAARPQSGAHGLTLDPKGRASATVQLPILVEKADIVSHADPTGERHIPIGELGMSRGRFPLGKDEEGRDPLSCDADHGSRAAAAPAAPSYGCGC